MKRFPRTTVAAAIAGAASIAIIATGCSAGADTGKASDEPDHPDPRHVQRVRLPTRSSRQYEEDNPNITIKHKKAATSNEARDNLNTRLAAGSRPRPTSRPSRSTGSPSCMQYSDKFIDLDRPDVDGRWLDWKVNAGHRRPTAASSATAPTSARRPSATAATCSPQPACRPTARRSPSSVGDDARGTTTSPSASSSPPPVGKPFFDSARRHLPGHDQPARGRLRGPGDGTIIADRRTPRSRRSTTPSSRPASPTTCRRTSSQWSDDWTAELPEGRLRDHALPRLDARCHRGQRRAASSGWDIADIFPGGGGNWGGSFLTVPRRASTRRRPRSSPPG